MFVVLNISCHSTDSGRDQVGAGNSVLELSFSWPNCLSNICGIQKQFLFCFPTAADYWQSLGADFMTSWCSRCRCQQVYKHISVTQSQSANQRPRNSQSANQRPGNCHWRHFKHHSPGQKTSITLLVSVWRVDMWLPARQAKTGVWSLLIGAHALFQPSHWLLLTLTARTDIRVLIWPFDRCPSDLRWKQLSSVCYWCVMTQWTRVLKPTDSSAGLCVCLVYLCVGIPVTSWCPSDTPLATPRHGGRSGQNL